MNYKDEIKAIVFDYDGTLIDFDYKASDYTRKAFAGLSKQNYKIGLASGRPCFLALRAFDETFKECSLDYVLGCNGSEFMDVKKGETQILYPMQPEDVVYLGKIFADCDFLYLGIYDGETFLINKPINDPVLIGWMEARWLKPVVYDYSLNKVERSKVIVLNNPDDRQRETEFLSSLDLSAFNSFYSTKTCFEIAPKGISKLRSCEVLAERLGCGIKQILSFGDGDNDMDMLRGTTGVIMENAREDLKQQIPLQTGDVKDEGIYRFLKENGLI